LALSTFSSALSGRSRLFGMSLGFRFAAPQVILCRAFGTIEQEHRPLIREQSNPPDKLSQRHLNKAPFGADLNGAKLRRASTSGRQRFPSVLFETLSTTTTQAGSLSYVAGTYRFVAYRCRPHLAPPHPRRTQANVGWASSLSISRTRPAIKPGERAKISEQTWDA
jgi:hypothetical protein